MNCKKHLGMRVKTFIPAFQNVTKNLKDHDGDLVFFGEHLILNSSVVDIKEIEAFTKKNRNLFAETYVRRFHRK